MATGNAVWGIEIGQCALKALKLRHADEGLVEAVAFDVIEHPKILSQPDADPEEIIKAALEKFASRNDWSGDQFVIGIPGQQTFARFCKLPPVDPKKIPDIVRFEAGQQIPFDMSEVVWDYHVFSTEDSPDVEIGIFAIRKDIIRTHIENYGKLNIAPAAVQTLPSALYNFVHHDLDLKDDGGAVVIIDVGAQNTDLIIAGGNSTWTRNIPLGGNNFTEALIKAFKLSFSKAENLKKTAATSKYARQIFQAMRPVFADLVAEIQRSLGYYSSSHRDVELTQVLALGNAFRLPGLQKYLANNLSIAGGVHKLEKFNKVAATATINAPEFADNILSFGAAYGLALQGLGLGKISASLLPPDLARIAVWNKKRPWFVAAAACLGLAAIFPHTRNWLDESALAANAHYSSDAKRIIDNAQSFRSRFDQVRLDTTQQEERIKNLLTLQNDKRVIPYILSLIHEAMPELDPPAVAEARTPEALKKLISSNPAAHARTRRRQILIESCNIQYVKDVEKFQGSSGAGGQGGRQTIGFEGMEGIEGGMMGGMLGGGREFREFTEAPAEDGGESGPIEGAGFYVSIVGRLLYGESRSEAAGLLSEVYFTRLRELGQVAKLGFYVLDKDKQVRDQEKNPNLFRISPYYADATGRREFGRRGRQAFTVRGTMPAEGEAENNPFADPVTGEDMSKDWRFEMGFKIKLGEKPEAEEPGEAG